MNKLSQLPYIFRFSISTHKSNTGHIITIFFNKPHDSVCCQRISDVFPKILTMTTRTSAWTTRNIDSKSYLIGYFLKNDACIYVFQHLLKLHRAFVCFCIITTVFFLLTRFRKIAYSFQISNNTCHIVDIF